VEEEKTLLRLLRDAQHARATARPQL
jgi:hypothetical protein